MYRSGAILATALLLAACGQTPVVQAPESSGSVALQTATVQPEARASGESRTASRWVQGSEGLRERPTANGPQSAFMGPRGTQRAMGDREAFVARMTQIMAERPGAEERRARFESYRTGEWQNTERTRPQRTDSERRSWTGGTR